MTKQQEEARQIAAYLLEFLTYMKNGLQISINELKK